MYARQIDEIRSGNKTQTRRVCKPGESLHYDEVQQCLTVIGANNRVKWRVGGLYRVSPKRGQSGVLMIEITGIRREPLHFLNPAAAHLEGIRVTPEQEEAGQSLIGNYRALWESINGNIKGSRWADNPVVWVLTFKLVYPYLHKTNPARIA